MAICGPLFSAFVNPMYDKFDETLNNGQKVCGTLFMLANHLELEMFLRPYLTLYMYCTWLFNPNKFIILRFADASRVQSFVSF